MKVMVPPSQNGLSVSTARNVKDPVTDRPWSSCRHKFRFLSKTYFLTYAGLGGRHDHRIDYATPPNRFGIPGSQEPEGSTMIALLELENTTEE
ncbi:hypothetical protein MTO96_041949 [Rhipicephalus appendiculatus]